MAESPKLSAASSFDQTTRIDPPHEPQQPEANPTPAPRRRKRRGDLESAAVQFTVQESTAGTNEPSVEAPSFVADPPDVVQEIVVRHADDLSLHLAERLREVERREVELAESQAELLIAESAAKSWVSLRDSELSAREREVALREDEASTRAAAVAAAELASQEELRTEWDALTRRSADLDHKQAELQQWEDCLRTERAALEQATEKLRAERRREDELQRARRQQWQARIEADRAQVERAMANLQRHRQSLDERERELQTREQQRDHRPAVNPGAHGSNLESAALRAEAAREHRAALEHRWIAGQLWSRLAGGKLVADDELQQSLDHVREQLQMLYRRERESLQDLRTAIVAAGRELMPAPRVPKSRPRREALCA